MESLLNELHPYIVEGLGLLILSILAAVGALVGFALNSLRNWLDSKGLNEARDTLDDVIWRAKRAFPSERLEGIGMNAANQLAIYLETYARKTSPKVLKKLKVDDSAIAERMAKEAAIWLKEQRETDALLKPAIEGQN